MRIETDLHGEMEREVLGDLEGFKYSESIKDKSDQIIEGTEREGRQRFIDVYDFLNQASREGAIDEDSYQERYQKLRAICFMEYGKTIEDIADYDLEIVSQIQHASAYLSKLGVGFLSDNSIGYEGINGREFIAPDYVEISRKITPEKRAQLLEKKKQGFEKLIITPIGLKLFNMVHDFSRLVVENSKQGNLQTASGEKITFDDGFRIQSILNEATNEKPDGIYYNVRPDKKAEEFTYCTKDYALGPPHFPECNRLGWKVSLVENLANLPKRDEGEIVGERPQFEAYHSAKYCWKTIMFDPIYIGESFWTIEDWLVFASKKIIEEGVMIDDFEHGVGSNLLGNIYSDKDIVSACYDFADNKICLYRSNPYPHQHLCARTLVSII